MWGKSRDFFLSSPVWWVMYKIGILGKKAIAASRTAELWLSKRTNASHRTAVFFTALRNGNIRIVQPTNQNDTA